MIVAVYFATRLTFADRLPYFVDEGSYADFSDRAASSLDDLFVGLTIGPRVLQTWLGIPLIELGIAPLHAMRAVSVAAGLATVLVVALVANRMAGRPAALTAGVACVALPLLLVHDGIGILEPLLMLLMAAALYLQIEFARKPDLRLAAVLGLVLAGGVLAKETAWAAVVLLPVSLLVFDWSAQGRDRRLRTWLAGAALALSSALAAELLMRSSSYWSSLEELRDSPLYTVRSFGDVLDEPFASVDPTWSVFGPSFTGYFTWPLLAAAAAGAVLGLRRQPRLTALLLAWFALPLAGSLLFSTSAYPRHLLPLAPPLVVLLSYALVEAGAWARRVLPARAALPALATCAVVLWVPALLLDARVLDHPSSADYPSRDDWQYVTGAPAGSQWPAVAEAIERYAAGKRVVVLTPTADANVVRLLLDDDPLYVFVSGDSPEAPQARLALTEEHPYILDVAAVQQMQRGRPRVIARFHRPRGGDVIELSELTPR